MLRGAQKNALKRLQFLACLPKPATRTKQQQQFLMALPRFPGLGNPLGGMPVNLPLGNFLPAGGNLPVTLDKGDPFKMLFRQQIEQIRFQTAILKDFERFDSYELSVKMRDANPMVRSLAIQSASLRRLHCEKELVNRLKDPVPAIRDAARNALVRIGRGADFGPFAPDGPTLVAISRERNEAVARWQQWLKTIEAPAAKSMKDTKP
jgi:hypothetical protein